MARPWVLRGRAEGEGTAFAAAGHEEPFLPAAGPASPERRRGHTAPAVILHVHVGSAVVGGGAGGGGGVEGPERDRRKEPLGAGAHSRLLALVDDGEKGETAGVLSVAVGVFEFGKGDGRGVRGGVGVVWSVNKAHTVPLFGGVVMVVGRAESGILKDEIQKLYRKYNLKIQKLFFSKIQKNPLKITAPNKFFLHWTSVWPEKWKLEIKNQYKSSAKKAILSKEILLD